MTKKNTPFLYPQFKHRRKFSPQYITNQSYKPYLREEFSKKCVYCCKPDFLNKDSFGVDHYKPKNKFPDLEWKYSNLFYVCNACNSRKGDSWPTEEQFKANIFLPNPCDHVMYEHLKYCGNRVETRSAAGKYTDDILDLNDDDSLEFREKVTILIDSLILTLKESEKNLYKLNSILNTKRENTVQIDNDKKFLEENCYKIKNMLKNFGI